MSTPYRFSMLSAALLAALATAPLAAQDAPPPSEDPVPVVETTSVPADRLAGEYAEFAGSETNAAALVEGLRNGGPITISEEVVTVVENEDGTTTETITVVDTVVETSTGPMGWGNVDNTLALAEALLAQQGITDPTGEEIAAALEGGVLTVDNGDGTTSTIEMGGVLALRAEGMGWGQIAQEFGFKLGDVKRSDRARPALARVDFGARANKVEKTERVARIERPDRPVRPEKVERPERPEKPERPDKPERAGRPGG